jgi:polyphosphate kinase 2 (PPK2 family)
LVKFWLHIGKDEQMRRFQQREITPQKQWKLTDEDWRNRGKWEDYLAAAEQMLLKTSTRYAPWTIVEANFKWYARVKCLHTVVDVLNHEGISRGGAGEGAQDKKGKKEGVKG